MGAVIPPAVLADLHRLVALLRTDGPDLWVGETVLTGAASGGADTQQVVDALYAQWYLRTAAVPADPADPPQRDGLLESLTGYLRAAHAGSRVFEPGWVVLTRGGRGVCLVGRGEERRVVHPVEYVGLSRPGVPVAPGEQVAVTLRIDTVDEVTRWWATRSPAGEPEEPLGRFYVHARAEAAPCVVHDLTTRLLAATFPWSLKASTQTRGYQRPDAIVLYLNRADVTAARTTVTAMTAALGPAALHEETPPLTMLVAPGLGYAEDPGPDTSFGTSRCRALAPGVLTVAGADLGGEAAVRALLDALDAAGIDPEHPWREPVG